MNEIKEYVLKKLRNENTNKDYVEIINDCKNNTQFSFNAIETAIEEMLLCDKIKRKYTDNFGKFDLYINSNFEFEKLKY